MTWVQVERAARFPAEAGDADVVIDARYPLVIVWILKKRIGATQAKALAAQLNRQSRTGDPHQLGRVIGASLVSETAGAPRIALA